MGRERVATQWKKGTSHAGLVPGKLLLRQESSTEEAGKVHQKPLLWFKSNARRRLALQKLPGGGKLLGSFSAVAHTHSRHPPNPRTFILSDLPARPPPPTASSPQGSAQRGLP